MTADMKFLNFKQNRATIVIRANGHLLGLGII